MAVKLQIRGDTAAAWTAANPILAIRELAIETDTHSFKVGDGITAWNALGYVEIRAPIRSCSCFGFGGCVDLGYGLIGTNENLRLQ